ncbi:MAG: hypothetical protein HYY16_18690 [Planctomycetes bacterium]|nr:hypothetical protein [Planctomycetota bacterium]
MQFLAHVLELGARKDVGAQAVFINGNFVGPVFTAEEQTEFEAARKELQKELDHRRDYYQPLNITDVAMLGQHMAMNPANYRRQTENSALRTLRTLVGLKDKDGRFVELGRAGMRARRFYSDAEKLFKKSHIPVYLMADTVFAEDSIDPSRWLHFAWFSFAGYSIRGLATMDGDLSKGIPEFMLGVRRGGKAVALDEYPLASGDVIFAPSLNPLLHETLAAVPGKLVIVCGDGTVDLSYTGTILSMQKPLTAYLYRSEGARFVRRTYRYNTGSWGEPTPDDIGAAKAAAGRDTVMRRREIDEQARLAGFGADLVRFVDLVRAENPALADEIEKSRSRVDAIMTYVRELEAQRQKLLNAISTQRAGLERLVRALQPALGEERMARVIAVLNLPPSAQTDVAAIDVANVEVARVVAEAMAALSSQAPAAEKSAP